MQPPALQQEDHGEPTEEEEEAARRRTIADRMARLGGIKFGAAPPMPQRVTRPPPSTNPYDDEAQPSQTEEADEEKPELTEEEEERAHVQIQQGRKKS